MALNLYDTQQRATRAFVPQDPKRVTMYVCGPTVYNYAHIGNARPAVVFDVLVRFLRREFGAGHVLYARNVTDVDDKINAKAAEEGVPISDVAERYAEIYNADIEALGVLRPDFEPRATQHMDDIIAMIGALVERGAAYAAEGHVLFNVPGFADYGKLSGRNRDEMVAGARVEVAPYKRDPADFVLWKPSKPHEPSWESPWGAGRPGWHIECSAMIEKTLGETIDIHGGGLDLVFPHHENEVAQSVCAHDGKTFANYWLHNGMLEMDAEKMSKSVGNVALIRTLLEDWPGEVLRYALLSAHYRQPLAWTDELLQQSKNALDRLYGALRRLADVDAEARDPSPAFLEALGDDLNTPKALAEVFALAKEANKSSTVEEQANLKSQMLASGKLLGVLQTDPADWLQRRGVALQVGVLDAQMKPIPVNLATEENLSDADIDRLLIDRAEARARKDFAAADKIRDDLSAEGIVIEDGADGATWRRG